MNATMATNVTAKDAVQKVISEIMTWGKRLAGLALLGFIMLTLAKLFGFSLYPVQSMGWQEFGVFVAGISYAITR